MAKPIYIFAGGGTGGHLYPGLAVAEELARLRPGAGIVFACSHRPIDRRILDSLAYAAVPQAVRPLPRGPKGWWTFGRAWLSASGQAKDMVRDLRPAAVLGLGGFAAGPIVRRARGAGLPAALLNPDAVPGRANRFLAGRAEVVFTQFESTREHFRPGVREQVRCVGCPVRSGFFGADRGEAIGYFDLRAALKTLVIVGGSLGAASINEAILYLGGGLDALAGSWQVLHVTGRGNILELAERPDAGRIMVRQVEYCDRMELAYAAADLVLCRAGASTVAELAAAATPAVLMPYPYHRDQHQRLNAEALVAAGGAVICEDARDPAANARALRGKLLPLLRDADRLGEMSAAAGRLARQGAAREIAQWLTERG